MIDQALNILLNNLQSNRVIDNDGKFIIAQNADGLDMEDRIEKLKQTLDGITNTNN